MQHQTNVIPINKYQDHYQSPWINTKKVIKEIAQEFCLGFYHLQAIDKEEIVTALRKDLNDYITPAVELFYSKENFIKSMFFVFTAEKNGLDSAYRCITL